MREEGYYYLFLDGQKIIGEWRKSGIVDGMGYWLLTGDSTHYSDNRFIIDKIIMKTNE